VAAILTDVSTTVDSKTADIDVHLKQIVINLFIAEGENLICVYEHFLRMYGKAALYVCIV
jgi:hypothetical protein